MKHMKRFVSLILALAMTLAMGISVLAAGNYTVTIKNESEGHTYEAYQVFAGDLAGNVLSNISWGEGVNGDALLTDLKEESAFADCKSAADVAKVLEDNTALAKTFASIAGKHLSQVSGTSNAAAAGYQISGLEAGYYLIKDKDQSVPEGDSYTEFLLKVVKDITTEPKSDVPSVEKKVEEDDKYDQDGGYGNGYNDVADWNIGDKVPFKLIGTLPSNLASYDTYKYIFHDTLSSGLTYQNDAKVYVVNGDSKQEVTGNFEINADGTSLTISCDDIKKIAGVDANSKIVVEYTALLNKNAAIGLPGNPNEVYLEFSNNPNQSGEGDHETGETPEDKVIVFTYELDTTKVDGESQEGLKDAEFKLRNEDGKYAIVEDGVLAGWADTEEEGSVLTSDENGLFKVAGLDDGTYYLKETKAPEGYNKLEEEIQIVITATTSNGQNWTGTAGDALTALKIQVGDQAEKDGDTSSGIVSAAIENNKGATLPETGGIGTTIFYLVGGILVIGACVMLITKRRMNLHK